MQVERRWNILQYFIEAAWKLYTEQWDGSRRHKRLIGGVFGTEYQRLR